MRLLTHLLLFLLSHDFFLPLTVGMGKRSQLPDSCYQTHMISPIVGEKKKVRPRNGINIVMNDSSFIAVCFFFNLSNLSLSFHTWFQRSYKGGDGNSAAVLILTLRVLVSHGDKCYPPRDCCQKRCRQ